MWTVFTTERHFGKEYFFLECGQTQFLPASDSWVSELRTAGGRMVMLNWRPEMNHGNNVLSQLTEKIDLKKSNIGLSTSSPSNYGQGCAQLNFRTLKWGFKLKPKTKFKCFIPGAILRQNTTIKNIKKLSSKFELKFL